MFVQAMKCCYGCVYVSVIVNQICSKQLFVCACNGSAPGSAKEARHEMYVQLLS